MKNVIRYRTRTGFTTSLRQKGGNMKWLKSKRGQMSDAMLTITFLTFSGGLQDAYSYCMRGKVFANAQTGNIVLMSGYFFDGDFHKGLHYLIPVLAFVCGVFVAEQVHMRYKNMKRVHWRQLVVLAEVILLFSVGLMPESANMAANALTSFACAMQVQTFRKVNGYTIASTMCIGNLRSGTTALTMYFEDHKPEQLRQFLYYFGIIFFFAIGAGVGGVMSLKLGITTIWVSSVLLLISFLLMFLEKLR